MYVAVKKQKVSLIQCITSIHGCGYKSTVYTDLVSTLASDFMWTLKVGESGSDRSCSGVITWPTNCAGAENLGRRGRFKPATPSLDSVLDSA